MRRTRLILTLETATSVCSAALIKCTLRTMGESAAGKSNNNVSVISEVNELTAKRHNEILISLLNRLFEKSEYKLRDIDAVAVSNGPGSFTGLRVGLSFAKGLSLGLKIPIIPVNTLEALALTISSSSSSSSSSSLKVCPLVPARRGEAFGQIFKVSGDYIEPQNEPFIVDATRLQALTVEGIFCGGEGVRHLFPLIHPSEASEFALLDIRSGAAQIGRVAARQIENAFYSPAELYRLEPNYIKDFLLKSQL